MHGMHVSGIVGANDKEKNLYGVAPNAQILALKVFSDDLQYPTTFTDIWLENYCLIEKIICLFIKKML